MDCTEIFQLHNGSNFTGNVIISNNILNPQDSYARIHNECVDGLFAKIPQNQGY